MSVLDLHIEGIGFWAPGWPNWDAAAAGLRGSAGPVEGAAARPVPALLAPAERRRAPDPVLLACEVALQACAAAGRDAQEMASVFASTHGDLVITDYMCATLASAPMELSPIRFHNSVHNAPAGYWTIATHCHAPSTSISAWHASFAAGLFEAAVQAVSSDSPVMLAAYDTPSIGPLQGVSPSDTLFGVALVIAPFVDGSALSRLRLRMAASEPAESAALPAAFAALAAANPMAANSLAFLHALVSARRQTIRLDAGSGTMLAVEFC